MGHRARQGGWELGPRQQGKCLKTAVTGTCWLQTAHFALTCNKGPRAATTERGTGGKQRQKDNSPEPTQPFRTTETHQGKGCRVHLSPAGLWAELSLPQKLRDQGLSLQTALVGAAGQESQPRRFPQPCLDAAGGGIGAVFHHPCPQPPLSWQSCITSRCPLPPPHTQRGTALLEWQISGYLPANNPSGSLSARPCKQAPFPVSGALSEGQDGPDLPDCRLGDKTEGLRSGAVCKRSL